MDVDEHKENDSIFHNYDEEWEKREEEGHWNIDVGMEEVSAWDHFDLRNPVPNLEATFSEKVDENDSEEREYLDLFVTADEPFDHPITSQTINSVLRNIRTELERGDFMKNISFCSAENCQKCVASTAYFFLVDPGVPPAEVDNENPNPIANPIPNPNSPERKFSKYTQMFTRLPTVSRRSAKTGIDHDEIHYFACENDGKVSEFIDRNIPRGHRITKNKLWKCPEILRDDNKEYLLNEAKRILEDNTIKWENLVRALEWNPPEEPLPVDDRLPATVVLPPLPAGVERRLTIADDPTHPKYNMQITTDPIELCNSFCAFLDSHKVNYCAFARLQRVENHF